MSHSRPQSQSHLGMPPTRRRSRAIPAQRNALLAGGRMTELVRYDAMCRAIAEAYEVDEVKDIRDKALALEVYARQPKNIDAEWHATEIRLRAERRAGQLLKETERAKGGRPTETPRPDQGVSKTLANRGISYDHPRGQKLADVPEGSTLGGARARQATGRQY
jgi:hypothetical protein